MTTAMAPAMHAKMMRAASSEFTDAAQNSHSIQLSGPKASADMATTKTAPQKCGWRQIARCNLS